MLKRVKLFEYNFISEKDIEIVTKEILDDYPYDYEDSSKLPLVITPNLDYIVKLNQNENAELNSQLQNANYILPDGQPIVWSSFFFKNKISNRLAGSDFFIALWRNIINEEIPTLVLVANEQISIGLKNQYAKAYTYTLPYFDKNDSGTIKKIASECSEIVSTNNIQILLIGASFPKQDKIGLSIFDELKLKYNGRVGFPLIALLGASFEFHLGLKKRAPQFVQKIGFEWLHRLLNEPKRLGKRYLIDSWPFLRILLKETIKRKTEIKNG